jgi:hypothetical protein
MPMPDYSALYNYFTQPAPDPEELDKKQIARRLTEGERRLLFSVFGDQIKDYEAITIRLKPSLEKPWYSELLGEFVTGAQVPVGTSDIYVNPDCYYDDFSQASYSYQGLFIHEATHVWQNQNASREERLAQHLREHEENGKNGGTQFDLYKYRVGRDVDFRQMGAEQQARLIQDTYVRQNTWQDNPNCWRLDRGKEMLKNIFPLAHDSRPCKNMDAVAEAVIKNTFNVPTLLMP